MNVIDRTISFFLPVVPKPLVGYFSRPYIAGAKLDEALQVVRDLEGEGALATLDILGEFVSTKEEARRNTDDYVALLKRMHEKGMSSGYVSVKLSALGLLVDRELCLNHMRELMHLAVEADTFVRLDMEDSACTTPTLDIYRTLREEFPGRVGVVLQAMLRRTLDDVDALTAESASANFRLCKGIYIEPFAVAYIDYEIIRRNFVAALERMFEKGAYVGIATHDELLICEALRLINRYGLTTEQYEFQMLLGVRPELRKILIDAGHRLRVYVPYGPQWYAYSVRRLRENPTIAGYAFRSLFKRAET